MKTLLNLHSLFLTLFLLLFHAAPTHAADLTSTPVGQIRWQAFA